MEDVWVSGRDRGRGFNTSYEQFLFLFPVKIRPLKILEVRLFGISLGPTPHLGGGKVDTPHKDHFFCVHDEAKVSFPAFPDSFLS